MGGSFSCEWPCWELTLTLFSKIDGAITSMKFQYLQTKLNPNCNCQLARMLLSNLHRHNARSVGPEFFQFWLALLRDLGRFPDGRNWPMEEWFHINSTYYKWWLRHEHQINCGFRAIMVNMCWTCNSLMQTVQIRNSTQMRKHGVRRVVMIDIEVT